MGAKFLVPQIQFILLPVVRRCLVVVRLPMRPDYLRAIALVVLMCLSKPHLQILVRLYALLAREVEEHT